MSYKHLRQAGIATACTVQGVVVGAGGGTDAASHVAVIVDGGASVFVAATVYIAGVWGVGSEGEVRVVTCPWFAYNTE